MIGDTESRNTKVRWFAVRSSIGLPLKSATRRLNPARNPARPLVQHGVVLKRKTEPCRGFFFGGARMAKLEGAAAGSPGSRSAPRRLTQRSMRSSHSQVTWERPLAPKRCFDQPKTLCRRHKAGLLLLIMLMILILISVTARTRRSRAGRFCTVGRGLATPPHRRTRDGNPRYGPRS